MDEYYIGEIRIFGCNYPPAHWAFCDGTILQIRTYPVLFAVIGNRFGGDGKLTFAVPDLRGSVAQGMNAAGDLGKIQGAATVTLTDENMPSHTHTAYTNNTRPGNLTGDDKLPARFISAGANAFVEDSASSLVSLSPKTMSAIGGGAAHNNMQPFLPMNFCIALEFGEYPPRP